MNRNPLESYAKAALGHLPAAATRAAEAFARPTVQNHSWRVGKGGPEQAAPGWGASPCAAAC